jgi:hypothetical protein
MDIESQQLIDKPQQGESPKWLKWLPLGAFIMACLSFLFALTVLYPWHIELSKEFTELSKKITQCK